MPIRWAHELSPEAASKVIRRVEIALAPDGTPIFGLAASVWNAPVWLEQVEGAFEIGVVLREDRPEFAALEVLFPVLAEIGFPVEFSSDLARCVQRASKVGVRELEAVQVRVEQAIVRHLRALAGVPLPLALAQKAGVEPPVFKPGELERVTADRLVPLARFAPAFYEYKHRRLVPEPKHREGLKPPPEGGFSLEADPLIHEAMTYARPLGLLLRYRLEIARAIGRLVWGGHPDLEHPKGGRPPLSTEELKRTVEVVLALRRRYPRASEVQLRRKAASELDCSGSNVRARLLTAYERFYPEREGELVDPDNLEELLRRIERGEEADTF
ncbi:hypothetical protein ABUL39_13040 [Rhodothermus marinus]